MSRLLQVLVAVVIIALVVTIAFQVRSLFNAPKPDLTLKPGANEAAEPTTDRSSGSDMSALPADRTTGERPSATKAPTAPVTVKPAQDAIPAGKRVGQVQFVAGKATAVSPSGHERILNLEAPIFLNDRISCDPKAKLQLALDDGSVLWIGETSSLTVDEYVYSPAAGKQVSCVLRFIQGACRLATGAITALNPEGFKVRTRMATVGIRGCGVAFKDEAQKNDIYVLDLGDGESVLVETTTDGSLMMDPATGKALRVDPSKRKTLNIEQPGFAVTVTVGQEPNKWKLTIEDIQKIQRETSHLPPAKYDLLQKPDGAVVIVRPQAKASGQNE